MSLFSFTTSSSVFPVIAFFPLERQGSGWRGVPTPAAGRLPAGQAREAARQPVPEAGGGVTGRAGGHQDVLLASAPANASPAELGALPALGRSGRLGPNDQVIAGRIVD